MATTKIWAIKDSVKRVIDYTRNPKKTEISDDLWAVLHYSMNPNKVITRYEETTAFVTGVGCSAENAYQEMMQIKHLFGKNSGNQAYHAYQSFKPNEVTPQECHEIGVNLARKLWGRNYQVLVSTHLDKNHYHNHFVINSVSYINGKMFDCSEKTYYEFRRVSDEMCAQRGLSVIKNPKGHTPRTLYFAEKRGEPTKYNLMREAIDKAAAMSITRQQFVKALLKMGYVYEVNPNRKYPTIRSVNSKKAVRLYHLGEEYLPEKIDKRLSLNPYRVQRNWESFMYPQKFYAPKRQNQSYRLKGSFSNTKKISGIQAVFLIFGYLIGAYPTQQEKRRKPLSPEMREACRRLDRFTEKTTLMSHYGLHTNKDVEQFIVSAEVKINELSKERRKLYDKITRSVTEADKAVIRKESEGYTEKISILRKQLRTAHRIIDELPEMKKCISAERNMQALQREMEKPQRQKQRNGWER